MDSSDLDGHIYLYAQIKWPPSPKFFGFKHDHLQSHQTESDLGPYVFAVSILGQVYEPTWRTTSRPAQPVLVQRSWGISLNRLLKQLPSPRNRGTPSPWILLNSSLHPSGFTSILMVVDCLFKQCIFIPTHTTRSPPLSLQSYSSSTSFPNTEFHPIFTSDRDLEFMSHFFWSLGKTLGHLTPFHLQSSSGRQQPDWADESNPWAVPLDLQVPTSKIIGQNPCLSLSSLTITL